MLWLGVHLPLLPLEAFGASASAGANAEAAAPCCVVEQRRVGWPDAAARAAGIAPGMALASALALVPALRVLEREREREAALLQLLALAASRYTPQLALRADGLLLDIEASLRLFGGLRRLTTQLRATLHAAGVRPRIGLAPTPAAAWLFANLPDARGQARRARQLADLQAGLDALPLLPALQVLGDAMAQAQAPPRGAGRARGSSAASKARPTTTTTAAAAAGAAEPARSVGADAAPSAPVRGVRPSAGVARSHMRTAAPGAAALHRLAELLHGIGCRCLGDVRALPSAELAERGGVALQQALARAYGEAPDPQRRFEPPPAFDAALELPQRADDAAMLMFGAQRLLQALAGWLHARCRAAACFTLRLQHENQGRHARPPTPLRIELGQPSADAAQLAALLHERLQRCQLPAPVYGLALRLDASQPWPGTQPALALAAPGAAPPADAASFAALLDRLAARLGAEQVRRLVPYPDHRPEHASRWLPAQAGAFAWTAATPAAAVAITRAAAAARAARRQATNASDSSVPAPKPGAVDHPPIVDRPTAAPPRPLWLLPQPLPLAERDGRPHIDGMLADAAAAPPQAPRSQPPQSLQPLRPSPQKPSLPSPPAPALKDESLPNPATALMAHGLPPGPLRLLGEPERIECGWFDDRPLRRDYQLAQGADHRLYWLFRERPQRHAAADARWFLHGCFG